MNSFEEKIKKHPYIMRGMEILMVLVLALYPLRHIHRGLDLWDVGYNYANFEFMGMDSMDPMWLFSTYVSTFVGHILSFMPFGKTLLGMNFYTGLSVSVIAILAYLFCTRELKMPKIAAFLGEFVAISFCWCPTALLYNYLTFLLMMLCSIYLYRGLLKGKNRYLFIAGILLGVNVFVRFSNLPEVVFIFAVWVYGILETNQRIKDVTDAVKKREKTEGFLRTLRRTLFCVGGYLLAVLVLFLFLGIRYGFAEYFAGIKRLLGMSEVATNYSAKSMLRAIFNSYYVNSYWLIRIAFFALCGVIACVFGKHADAVLGIREGVNGVFGRRMTYLKLTYGLSVLSAVFCIIWLCKREFSAGEYYEYLAITRPGVLLLMLIIIFTLVEIFRPSQSIPEKLIAGLILITIMITPIGSNTGVFPAYNNLFLAMPWFVWKLWKFLLVKEWPAIVRSKAKLSFNKVYTIIKSYISLFPIKAVLVLVTCALSFWIIAFGTEFSFAEAENAKDPYYTMEENRTLRNIRMSYDKANGVYGVWGYLDDNNLLDRELITYGYIPSLSFYLQMPSAFNPWIDLPSYGVDVLENSLNTVVLEAESGEKTYPVIITKGFYAADTEPEKDILLRKTIGVEGSLELEDPKWDLLKKYMSENGYELKYYNSSFAVYTN